MPRVMVALDGSRLAEEALPYALAELAGGELILLHVVEPLNVSHVPVAAALRGPGFTVDEAWEYLESWAARLQEGGWTVHLKVEQGTAREQIVASAGRERAELLVLSSHGRHGLSRWLLGSVAENVCRSAPCPVLMVAARGESAGESRLVPHPVPRTVLIPLDMTEHAEAALGHLQTWKAEPRPRLILLSAVDLLVNPSGEFLSNEAWQQVWDELRDYLERQAETLRTQGWTVECRTESGRACPSILERAEAEDVDLILMATHGRTGFERWLRGSVAENVVRHAPCAVLLVKPSQSSTSTLSTTRSSPP